MNLKNLLDEVRVRGEKLKTEILDEIVNSKTLNQIVSHKNFVRAVGHVLETKNEVKRVIRHQVRDHLQNLFQIMNVPSKREISRIGEKISAMELSLEKIGTRRMPIQSIPKSSGLARKAKKASAVASGKSGTAAKKVVGKKIAKKSR